MLLVFKLATWANFMNADAKASPNKGYYHAVAFISDVHGNIEALDAVLQDIAKLQVNVIYCLGDLVGYGTDPVAVIRKIMELKESGKLVGIVCGNHDYGVATKDFAVFNSGARLSNEWTVQQLANTPEQNFLNELAREPLYKEIGRFRLVHGTLNPPPEQWEYLRSKNAAQNFVERAMVFVGHSHSPALYSKYSSGKDWNPIELFANEGFSFFPKPKNIPMQIGKSYSQYRLQVPHSFPTLIINPGSVGQPRDDNPHARYVVYVTTDYNSFLEYRQVGYDVETSVQKLNQRRLACDMVLATRLCTGGSTKFDEMHAKPSWFPEFCAPEGAQTMVRIHIPTMQQEIDNPEAATSTPTPSSEVEPSTLPTITSGVEPSTSTLPIMTPEVDISTLPTISPEVEPPELPTMTSGSELPTMTPGSELPTMTPGSELPTMTPGSEVDISTLPTISPEIEPPALSAEIEPSTLPMISSGSELEPPTFPSSEIDISTLPTISPDLESTISPEANISMLPAISQEDVSTLAGSPKVPLSLPNDATLKGSVTTSAISLPIDTAPLPKESSVKGSTQKTLPIDTSAQTNTTSPLPNASSMQGSTQKPNS